MHRHRPAAEPDPRVTRYGSSGFPGSPASGSRAPAAALPAGSSPGSNAPAAVSRRGSRAAPALSSLFLPGSRFRNPGRKKSAASAALFFLDPYILQPYLSPGPGRCSAGPVRAAGSGGYIPAFHFQSCPTASPPPGPPWLSWAAESWSARSAAEPRRECRQIR